MSVFNTGILIHNAGELAVGITPVQGAGTVLLRFGEHPDVVTLADDPGALRDLLVRALVALADQPNETQAVESPAKCWRCGRTITYVAPTPLEVENHNNLEAATPRISLTRHYWADDLDDSIPFYCGANRLHEVDTD